jgi:hypothetical protein
VSSPKLLTAELTVVIDQAGVPSLNRILDLDNFVQQSTTELTLCYATTENALCCENPTQVTVYALGYVPGLASVTGLLYTNSDLLTEAAPGFYSDDINCTP